MFGLNTQSGLNSVLEHFSTGSMHFSLIVHPNVGCGFRVLVQVTCLDHHTACRRSESFCNKQTHHLISGLAVAWSVWTLDCNWE